MDLIRVELNSGRITAESARIMGSVSSARSKFNVLSIPPFKQMPEKISMVSQTNFPQKKAILRAVPCRKLIKLDHIGQGVKTTTAHTVRSFMVQLGLAGVCQSFQTEVNKSG